VGNQKINMVKKKVTRKNVNSLLNKSLKLPIQTVTFVPSTTVKSKRITKSSLAKRVVETRLFLSKCFGGYTSSIAVGGYVMKTKSGKKVLIKEPVVKVTSYAKKSDFTKNKKLWLDWCKHKKKSWGQDSIGIIIENDMYYI